MAMCESLTCLEVSDILTNSSYTGDPISDLPEYRYFCRKLKTVTIDTTTWAIRACTYRGRDMRTAIANMAQEDPRGPRAKILTAIGLVATRRWAQIGINGGSARSSENLQADLINELHRWAEWAQEDGIKLLLRVRISRSWNEVSRNAAQGFSDLPDGAFPVIVGLTKT